MYVRELVVRNLVWECYVIYIGTVVLQQEHSVNRGNLWQLYIQLRTGHAPLNHHLFRIKAVNSPVCTGCNWGHETVKHYFLDCLATSRLRGSRPGKRSLFNKDLTLASEGTQITHDLHLENRVLPQSIQDYGASRARKEKWKEEKGMSSGEDSRSHEVHWAYMDTGRNQEQGHGRGCHIYHRAREWGTTRHTVCTNEATTKTRPKHTALKSQNTFVVPHYRRPSMAMENRAILVWYTYVDSLYHRETLPHGV